MNQNEEDFKKLRQLLALKRQEQPPPGYFYYLPEKIMVRIQEEKDELAEHSTWWQWLVQRFDARPLVAGAYACAISGLLLMGFRVSQEMKHEANSTLPVTTPIARLPDPNNFRPSEFLQSQFGNPVELFTSTELVYDPAPLPFTNRSFGVKAAISQ